MHIHWYPGHIAKAERQLKEKLNLVDVVIEVRDSRLPLSSSYANIEKLLGDKPRLLLLNKADLTDKTELKKWVSYLKQTTERTAPHRYFHPAEFLWLPKWKRQRLKCPSPDSPPSMRKRLRSAIQQYHRQTAAAHA